MGKIEKFDSFNESNEQDKFILLQDIGKFKKGKTFDSFGGLVSGVVVDLGDGKEKTIKFYDKDWFKLKK
jgi:hypothetical protein